MKNTTFIFTLPNADTGSQELIQMIHNFVSKNFDAFVFSSMGQVKYFSCVAQVDGVIGNSSSGLTEVPSFKKGTINIGDRQKGRLRAESVIDCEANESSISAALKILYSDKFLRLLPRVVNPYGDGGASSKVIKHLRTTSLENIVKKTFYDL